MRQKTSTLFFFDIFLFFFLFFPLSFYLSLSFPSFVPEEGRHSSILSRARAHMGEDYQIADGRTLEQKRADDEIGENNMQIYGRILS